MDVDYLKDWAKRAALELSSYAEAAEHAGCQQADTEQLIAELADILAGRPIWQRHMPMGHADEPILL